jgi:pentatricopeptide repeat protein
MKREGFSPNIYTFHALLSACSHQGDIKRAVSIWNDMIRSSLDQPEMSPNQVTFTHLFRCFGTAISLLRRNQSIDIGGPEFKLDIVPTADSALIQAHSVWLLDFRNGFTIKSLYAAADHLWTLLSNPESRPDQFQIDEKLLDSYLNLLCSQPVPARIPVALEFLNTEYSKFNLEPAAYAYTTMLHAITKDKTFMQSHGSAFFDRFLEWYKVREERFKNLSEPLTGLEKETVRKTECRDRDVMHSSFMYMVRGYTRINELKKAMDTIEESQKFLSPFYLKPVLFKDVWALVEKVRDIAEDGDWELAKRLSSICAKPEDDPILSVRKALKMKNAPIHWWGWKTLGFTPKETKKFLKLSAKAKEKAKQRLEAKQSK